MNSRFHTLKFLGLLLSAGLVSAPAMAEENFISAVTSLIGVKTGTANASVTILSPLGISETTAMNFGNVVSSSALGTVVLTPGGSRSVTGGAGTMGQPGDVAAASFSVKGQNGATYSVGLPILVLLDKEGGVAMRVTAFTSNLTSVSPELGLWSGALDEGGAQTFNVGATLNVGTGQVEGLYEGQYSVLIAYN